MDKNIILRWIKQACLRQLLAGTIFLIIALVLLFFNRDKIYNYLFGPFQLDAEEILQIDELRPPTDYHLHPEWRSRYEKYPMWKGYHKKDKQFFFSMKSAQKRQLDIFFTLPYAYIPYSDVEKGLPVFGLYFLLEISPGKMILMKSKNQDPQTPYSGIITFIDPMLEKLVRQQLYEGQELIPLLLDSTDHFKRPVHNVFMDTAICLAFFLINSIFALIWLLRPQKHYSFFRLMRQGRRDEFLEEIDRELKDGSAKLKGKNILGKRWIVHKAFFSIRIRRNHSYKQSKYK